MIVAYVVDHQARVPHGEGAVSISGRLIHEFLRRAVRLIEQAGVSERVAMTMTGHKTRSVFDRCHIVSQRDQREAARRTRRGNEVTPRQSQSANDTGQADMRGWADTPPKSVRKFAENVQQYVTGVLLLGIRTGSGEADKHQRVRKARDLTRQCMPTRRF